MIAAANNGEPDEPDENDGGRGKFVDTDPHRIRGSIKLIQRAIRNDYPMSPEDRAEIVAEMLDVMRNSEDHRAKIGAASTLLTADNINVKREAMDQKDEHAYLPKTHLHVHSQELPRLSDDDLERITLTGRFEEGGSGGTAGETPSTPEPA